MKTDKNIYQQFLKTLLNMVKFGDIVPENMKIATHFIWKSVKKDWGTGPFRIFWIVSSKYYQCHGEVLFLDSASIKVHPNTAGARRSSTDQMVEKTWKFLIFCTYRTMQRILVQRENSRVSKNLHVAFNFVRQNAYADTHCDLRA